MKEEESYFDQDDDDDDAGFQQKGSGLKLVGYENEDDSDSDNESSIKKNVATTLDGTAAKVSDESNGPELKKRRLG